LYDVIETDNYIGIVFEHTSGGELFDHILAHRYLKEKDACKLFAQLISGVHYIHRKKVVHRDLRLETLFLDRHRNLIIGDFGFANHFEDKEDDLMQTSCGSPCYAAPELVISEGKYIGTAVDIWSCGVILYAMLAGYLPFDDDPANPEGDNINLLYQYIVNTPLTFPDYISEEARDLLKLMLVTDPAHRGTLEQVMAHHWLEPYAHLFVKSVDELERAAIDQLQLKRQALGPTTRSHAPTAMPDATLDRPQLGGQQPPVNAVSKALAFVPSQASAPYLPEAGPSRAHGSSRAASIAVQPSFLSSAPASSRQHHASHAIASPQEISQAAAPANGDSLTRDVYAHPAAVAYAQAHPHRTIPTFGPYLLLQTISEGEFAKVKLGLHIQWGEEVAVKLLHRDNLDQQHMTEVEREIEVLRVRPRQTFAHLHVLILPVVSHANRLSNTRTSFVCTM
jgi:protein-serine/threonine kinase